MSKRPSASHVCEELSAEDAELVSRRARLLDQRVEVAQNRLTSTTARAGATNVELPLCELRPPLALKWRIGKDMPIKMSYVQSVVIGDSVYVGGGDALNDYEDYTVMMLDLQGEQWTTLPRYHVKNFAMTSLNGQLLLVGGFNPRTRKTTTQISVFEANIWTQPHPPMNIARDSSAVASFNNHIIVAGGDGDQDKRTSSVEVFDVASRTWYVADPLPNPRASMKSALLGSTLYLMGGLDLTNGWTKTVYTVDLRDLIDKSVHKTTKQTTPTLWQTIEDTPLCRSAPLGVGKTLLAVGGRIDRYNASSSVHLYQPDTRSWVEVGELPTGTARYDCTCLECPSGQFIVAGGYTGSYVRLRTVDFLSITYVLVYECK